MSKLSFRAAELRDLAELRRLLPELADFDVPSRREPRHLWEGDAALLEDVLAGRAPASFADVAANPSDDPIGLIIVTLREELLSHAPSAHLETLVVAPSARRQGLGRRLLEHAEARARAAGAASMTLHVFANNVRARALYDSHGYESELIRPIKWLD